MGLFSNLPFLKRSQPEAAAPAAPPAPEETSVPAPEESSLLVPATAPAAAELIEASNANRAEAEELVRQVVRELPHFITVAVVEAATGQILAGQWAGHSGGAVEVAAANAEIVRQTRQAIVALQLAPTEQLEDILITLQRQLHLLQIVPKQQWLLYLAVRTEDTNLALARAVLQSIMS